MLQYFFPHKYTKMPNEHRQKQLDNGLEIGTDHVCIVSNGIKYRWPTKVPENGQVLTATISEDNDILLTWMHVKIKYD